VTLWAGSAAAQTITSPTNTFASLLPGVSITVAAASVTPVTIGVARDDARIATVAASLVAGLNDIFALISSRSAVTTGTSSTGAATVSGGAFVGDSTVRDVNRRIMAAASQPIDGRSPSEFGIVITKSGTLEFNAEKFAAALAKDPAATQAALQTIASRVGDAARIVSDKYDGLLTGRITGQQSSVRDLSDRISDWDIRLTARRSTLERTYSALEVQLSSLNAQSSYLASQLASLSGSSTSQ
ncbi:MAG: flagellar filament capping protein FliD, partial [Microbacteriaceae bacterium]|nr:flagellar filament capping protein FliD [Microbacteriaceae bacterium]